MDFLRESFSKDGSLHHAYLIIGDRSSAVPALVSFFENSLGFPTHGNPDYRSFDHDSLGIEEGRMLKEMQEMRALGGGRKIFVVSTNGITEPAQNALLKVFEEPTPGTHFFLVMPSAEGLLLTFRSRLVIFSLGGKLRGNAEVEEFLLMSPGERMKFAKDFADDISDEKRTRAEAVGFVSGLEAVLRKKHGKKLLGPKEAGEFREILKTKDFLGDRSASVKMLLEHLGLVLPKPR